MVRIGADKLPLLLLPPDAPSPLYTSFKQALTTTNIDGINILTVLLVAIPRDDDVGRHLHEVSKLLIGSLYYLGCSDGDGSGDGGGGDGREREGGVWRRKRRRNGLSRGDHVTGCVVHREHVMVHAWW